MHVHTDDPGAALSLGTAVGTIDRIEIANMHEQTQQREERLLASVPDTDPDAEQAVTGIVAVVAGDGNRRLFESLAANGPIRIVEGGQTMNPSTADLLDALRTLDTAEAILLPNNSNVLLAAEQAALHFDRPVEVVPSDSIPAGLAAMVAFDGTLRRRRQRRGDAGGRRGGRDRRGDGRLARRRAGTASRSARASGSASRTASPSPAGRASRTSPPRSSTGSWRSRATC